MQTGCFSWFIPSRLQCRGQQLTIIQADAICTFQTRKQSEQPSLEQAVPEVEAPFLARTAIM